VERTRVATTAWRIGAPRLSRLRMK
jgi:hypothetical protein